MKFRESVFVLIMMTVTLTLTTACGGNRVADNEGTPGDSIAQETPEMQKDVTDSASVTDSVATTPDEEVSAKEPAAKQPTTKRNTTVNEYNGGKETMYISTYGANGKVWGHVTLNGKTGRGTIHDEDENSYSITVTRHGGELFGTDQNGRQYVFRL